MKKIMIAAAIVCAAAFAEAASAQWLNSGAATAKIKNGSDVWATLAKENTAAAYLLLASDMTEFKSSLDNGTFGTGKEGDAIGKAVDSTTAINASSGKITTKDVAANVKFFAATGGTAESSPPLPLTGELAN